MDADLNTPLEALAEYARSHGLCGTVGRTSTVYRFDGSPGAWGRHMLSLWHPSYNGLKNTFEVECLEQDDGVVFTILAKEGIRLYKRMALSVSEPDSFQQVVREVYRFHYDCMSC